VQNWKCLVVFITLVTKVYRSSTLINVKRATKHFKGRYLSVPWNTNVLQNSHGHDDLLVEDDVLCGYLLCPHCRIFHLDLILLHILQKGLPFLCIGQGDLCVCLIVTRPAVVSDLPACTDMVTGTLNTKSLLSLVWTYLLKRLQHQYLGAAALLAWVLADRQSSGYNIITSEPPHSLHLLFRRL